MQGNSLVFFRSLYLLKRVSVAILHMANEAVTYGVTVIPTDGEAPSHIMRCLGCRQTPYELLQQRQQKRRKSEVRQRRRASRFLATISSAMTIPYQRRTSGTTMNTMNRDRLKVAFEIPIPARRRYLRSLPASPFSLEYHSIAGLTSLDSLDRLPNTTTVCNPRQRHLPSQAMAIPPQPLRRRHWPASQLSMTSCLFWSTCSIMFKLSGRLRVWRWRIVIFTTCSSRGWRRQRKKS
jgi:hypothetical protein